MLWDRVGMVELLGGVGCVIMSELLLENGDTAQISTNACGIFSAKPMAKITVPPVSLMTAHPGCHCVRDIKEAGVTKEHIGDQMEL